MDHRTVILVGLVVLGVGLSGLGSRRRASAIRRYSDQGEGRPVLFSNRHLHRDQHRDVTRVPADQSMIAERLQSAPARVSIKGWAKSRYACHLVMAV